MKEWPEKEEVNNLTMTVLLLGIFVGVGSIILLSQRTFIRVDTVFHFILIAGFLALGIHRFFVKRMKRYLIEMVLYCFLGWGCLLTALFLALNFFIRSNEQTILYGFKEKAAIVVPGNSVVEVPINDQRFKYNQGMLSFSDEEIKIDGHYATEAWFTVADGLFGYEVLVRKELH